MKGPESPQTLNVDRFPVGNIYLLRGILLLGPEEVPTGEILPNMAPIVIPLRAKPGGGVRPNAGAGWGIWRAGCVPSPPKGNCVCPRPRNGRGKPLGKHLTIHMVFTRFGRPFSHNNQSNAHDSNEQQTTRMSNKAAKLILQTTLSN